MSLSAFFPNPRIGEFNTSRRVGFPREGDDQESDDTSRFRRSPGSLQAIFEEAINQHIEDYASNRDRDGAPAEGASSGSSSEQQSQSEDARITNDASLSTNTSQGTRFRRLLCYKFANK